MEEMHSMKDYGFTPDMLQEDPELENIHAIPARVTAVHKERYALVCEYGETYARLKTKEYYEGDEAFPTVGDFVLIRFLPGSDSQIIRTLSRRTFFSRRDPSPTGGEQAVAANFDYVFVMQSMNHDFNGRRLERYLALSWQSGAVPVVLLTKADLAQEHEEYIRTAQRLGAGVQVHAISAKTGFGMEALADYMRPGNTVVFLGSSGVGKSSLVNALAGEELMAVNEIREDDSKGRHTTTHRQLILLKSGAMIIDTPGMRTLGMWDVSEGLDDAFPDIEPFLGRCRFRDCKHQAEPGCAVREAIEAGELPRERWESYEKLKSEARYADVKAALLQRKQQRYRERKKQGRRQRIDPREYM